MISAYKEAQKLVMVLAITGVMLAVEMDADAFATAPPSNDINDVYPGFDAAPLLTEKAPIPVRKKHRKAPLMARSENAVAVATVVSEVETAAPPATEMTPVMQENANGTFALPEKVGLQDGNAIETMPILASDIPAQAPSPPPAKGFIEAGAQHYVLTGHEPSWEGEYVRGAWVQNADNVWNYELVNARRFGDGGTFYSGGLTHTFNEDWYGALALGSSSGGIFWPRERVDVFLHVKLLEQKNLVANIGYTHYQAKDAHHDQILHVGADYYFEMPLIVSAEFILNNSSPGNVNAGYGFLTAAYGHEKESYLTLRLGHGKEAYQLLGDAQVIAGFNSSVATITYRKWIGRDWGFNLVGEYYKNPIYKRRGIEIGIFKDF
ncbi:YaiO family outer membrane beta-barrel protein [Glaciimonas sp. GG7]